jgi:cytochrome oxidase Cu insertion factor (SCO1/SenC/PrrC family)
VSDAEARKRRRSRIVLVALFVLALAPIAGSYLLYFMVRDDGPWATSNQGRLLPVGTMRGDLHVAVPAVDDDSVDLDGQWWLVVVADRTCDDTCAGASQRLHALEILLNKDASRLRRGIVIREAADGDGGWAALAAADAGIARLAGAFEGMEMGIYLIDPLGNVVLHYPYEAAGRPVLDDVKRLMKVSQIG